MDYNTNSDELIEIRPDTEPEEDNDIKINTSAGSRTKRDTADDVNTEIAETVATVEPLVNESPEADDSDDFSAELEAMEQEEKELLILEEIGESLLEQVDAEIENSGIEVPTSNVLARQINEQTEQPLDDEVAETETKQKQSFFKSIPWWGYTVFGIVVLMIGFTIWATLTSSGKGTIIRYGSRFAANRVTFQPVEPVEAVDVPDESDIELINEMGEGQIETVPDDFVVVTPDLSPDSIQNETNASEQSGEGMAGSSTDSYAEGLEGDGTLPVIKSVYNILLIGEENIDSGNYRGRSDLIMLASINREQNSVKLISIMRDCLVSIPGYADNRINAAYAIGGVNLLYQTLKLNLGIEPDNYILVNFDRFENIIDAIGGVDIDVTAEEASYLNTTNYISNPAYRNLVKGSNHLNGNQALGYCRIRNVGTATHEYSDFGRTSRQRLVLNSIYKRAEDMNYLELMSFAGKCLPFVTTDLDADDIENYINMLLEVGISEGIDNYRIPIGGTFSDVRIRDMLVTQIDLEKNSKALHEMIYGVGQQ